MLGPLGAAGAPISPTFSAVSMSVTFGATLKITMQTKLRDDMTGGGGGGGGRKGKLSLCGNFLCFDVAPVRGRLHVRIRTRIGVRIGVRFGAKGGLQLNLGSIFSEMCLQTAVMGV
jgi:hypothetical protein